MNKDVLCAQNCWNSYNAISAFDHVFFGGETDDVWCGVKFYDDCIIVTFRGSTTIEDWFRDFQAVPYNDPDLGMVHKGFMLGLRDTYAFLFNLAQSNPATLPIYITGHSLGAARALLFTGLLNCYNIPCTTIVFGAPLPGCKQLKDILHKNSITSYKNGKDLVCDAPFWIPSFPVMVPVPFTLIYEEPPPNDIWGILSWHHSELYLKALQRLYP